MQSETFLFVNPKSGGNKGQVFLQVPQPFVVPLPDGGTTNLRIFSLLDGESGKKPGFLELKKAVARGPGPVRMIVGGGDGTIMWGVTEAESVGIDVQRQLLVGVAPLGTGNDFARAAGWGGKNPEGILDKECALLKSLVQLWCQAEPKGHDVWQVEVKVDEEDGDILRIDGGKKKSLGVKSISKTMVNYCSFGQDSKIGVKFDQNRTKNQYGNYAVYALACCSEEGRCWSAQHVGKFMHSMHHGTDDSGKVIFDLDDESEEAKLVGDPEMCIIVNIASYAGGLCHLWDTDDFRSGIDPAHETAEHASQPGDGKLEVVTVANVAALATDSMMHNAARVFSGGPLHFEFQTDDHDVVAYHNVDGEFFKLVNPDTATITRTRVLQVLHNRMRPGTTLEQLNDAMQNGVHLVSSSITQAGQLAQYHAARAVTNVVDGTNQLAQQTTQLAAQTSQVLVQGANQIGAQTTKVFSPVAQSAQLATQSMQKNVTQSIQSVKGMIVKE